MEFQNNLWIPVNMGIVVQFCLYTYLCLFNDNFSNWLSVKMWDNQLVMNYKMMWQGNGMA